MDNTNINHYKENAIDQSNQMVRHRESVQSDTYDHLNFTQQEVNYNKSNYKRKLIIFLTILTLILIGITIAVILSLVLTEK